MLILYIIIFLFFLVIVGGLFDAPFLPTAKKDFKRIARLIDPSPEKVIYDLGSGTGNLLFYLNKDYKAKGVGIEISPILYFFSKIKSLSVKDVSIIYGNFRKQDISKADVVYMFLAPIVADKAEKEILVKMKKGALLLVSGSEAEGLTPLKTSKEKGRQSYYLYKKD